MSQYLVVSATLLVCGALYLYHLNKVLVGVPPEALAWSPDRWTVSQIEQTAVRVAKSPPNTTSHLGPASGRRYIVLGGSGFLGGWIVLHLLIRGEDPQNIRIIDIRRPARDDLITGKAAGIGFVFADISDADSLRKAFQTPWPDATSKAGVTVFHTVAAIRYYERHPFFLPRSTGLNVNGTRNALKVAKEFGVDVFIYTSSATVPVPRSNFWVWPWQKYSTTAVQVARDEAIQEYPERKHSEFFSNYTYSKYIAEKYVCEADDPGNGFRTGCLRPGSAIFGLGDLTVGIYLERGTNPSWAFPMIHSFSYVENVSYGHLLYEQRLLEADSHSSRPVLSGRSFYISDPDVISFGDLYLALTTLSKGAITFPPLPPGLLYLVSHIIELYHLIQARYLRFLPPLSGDIIHLQPAMFHLVNVNLKVDHSRAALSPEQGGLGYQPPWTTLEGVCQVLQDHIKFGGKWISTA